MALLYDGGSVCDNFLAVKPSILITKRIYPDAVDFISQHCEIDYEETDWGIPPDQLLTRVRGKQGVINQAPNQFTAEVIAQLEGVKVISNVSVGFDNVDVPAATEAGILFTNTPDVLTDSTADFAFTLLLATARRLIEGSEFLRDGKWDHGAIDMMVGQDVHHQTLGIVGLGRIGQAVGRRAKGFSMRILYSDVARAPKNVEEELGAEYVPLERLLRESDFVSLHTPLNDATRRLISREQLRLMKPSSILVNTSRGPIVDEEALVEALREGAIAAAGLDVFEREPAVNPGLLDLPQVVVAPHIASASVDTRQKMSMMAVENAVAALHGERPPNLVNPELWERLPR